MGPAWGWLALAFELVSRVHTVSDKISRFLVSHSVGRGYSMRDASIELAASKTLGILASNLVVPPTSSSTMTSLGLGVPE